MVGSLKIQLCPELLWKLQLQLFPELLWKLLYDPGTQKAIVFVGINNPHLKSKDLEADPGLSLCPGQSSDLCSDLGWNFQRKKDFFKGFLVCCPYQDVKTAIEWLPDLGSPELLAFEDPSRRTSPRRRPTREDGDPDRCVLDVGAESGVKWPPIFYDAGGAVILPQKTEDDDDKDTSVDARTTITAGGVVTVSCPGSQLRLTGSTRSDFRCLRDSLLRAGTADQPVFYSDLSCVKSIEEDVVSTNKSCGPPEDPGNFFVVQGPQPKSNQGPML
jgi:hypothetical protein